MEKETPQTEVTKENATTKESTPPTDTKDTAPKPVSRKMLIFFFVLNLTVTATSIMAYDHFYAQKIAVINVDKYIAHLKELYIQGKISDADLNSAPDKLKAVINSVGKNTTILNEEAVLYNGNSIQIQD